MTSDQASNQETGHVLTDGLSLTHGCSHLGTKRKRDHLQETWKRAVEKELKEKGLRRWAETVSATDDRRAWKDRECSATAKDHTTSPSIHPKKTPH